MKEIDLLIFDFDGTIVNSGKDIAKSVNYTLNVLNVPTLSEGEILAFIGDGIQELLHRSLGKNYYDRFEMAFEIFTTHYIKHMLDTTELYSGTREVLDFFKNKIKIIVTNKRYHFTRKMTDSFGITDAFKEIIGADSTPYKKPAVHLLQIIMNRYQVTPSKIVVIGDGINDILFAKNAGAMSCAFLNGLGKREKLISLQPDYFYEELLEIKKFFY